MIVTIIYWYWKIYRQNKISNLIAAKIEDFLRFKLQVNFMDKNFK